MLHNTFCRRLAALVLTLAVAVSAVLPVFAVYPMPVQTATETESVYLFNADTGKTILSQNADQQKYVASLTKLMTALLLVESGKDLNGEVTVPTDLTQEFKDIQNANGTTMGLRIGETVRRIDLLNAMLIVRTPRRQNWAAPARTLPVPTACLTTATCPPRRIWQRSPPPARRTRPLHRWRALPATCCLPPICARQSTPSAAPTA